MYEKYAILQARIDELEAQKGSMRVLMLKDMLDRQVTKETTLLGTFSVTTTKKWKYPESVTKLEDEFKLVKAKSQTTGEATYDELQGIKFNPIKI